MMPTFDAWRVVEGCFLFGAMSTASPVSVYSEDLQ